MSNVPLAEQMRPKDLKNFVGQNHLINKNEIIERIIFNKKPTSLLLWGPPGCGKTTLARIIANETSADFIEISAVTSGISDVKKVILRAEQNSRLKIQTILFIDEIHRFNKAQQDAFLPHVENGLIILIGATTENPSYEVINPLISRMKVITLEPLNTSDIVKILKNTLVKLNKTKFASKKVLEYIALASGGDARVALGNLQLCLDLYNNQTISIQEVKNSIQKNIPGYDKNGDSHYSIISAFIKSMRGSDANATLYYLTRMLKSGEDPKFIARRMIIFASEDIGVASSGALNLAVSTFLAVERIGLPECQYNLYHCALALASCKKSRKVAEAMINAQNIVKDTVDKPVPKHLINASNRFMQNEGFGNNYKWESGYKPSKGFLPEELKDINLFG